MPYKNIVFIKLEKRLLNDPRFFMLSESEQLLYIKLILGAAETYNRLPKDVHALAKLCHLIARKSRIICQINAIKKAFPKFKENENHYYFEGFSEKTNYIQDSVLGNPKEIPRKSQGIPKEVTDKEEDKEEEEDKEKDKDNTVPQYLIGAWSSFLEMRKSIRKPAGQRAQELLLKKLVSLSADPDTQVKIINQSVMNSWQGFFELKGEYHGKSIGNYTEHDSASKFSGIRKTVINNG